MKILLGKPRHQYDQDADQEADDATVIDCSHEPSKTVQGAPDADINVLMKRMGITDNEPLPAQFSINDPRYYGDFTEAPTSLQEAMEVIRTAEERFAALPAALRTRFNNRPAELYAFINNPENIPEAVKLGLLVDTRPPKTEEPPKET